MNKKEDVKSKISELNITPIKPRDGLIGFVSFVFDNSFYLGSIGIHTKMSGGYRLTFPTRKENDYQMYHSINNETNEAIIELISEKVDEIICKMNS